MNGREFVFYVYDDDPDDPRFGFWLEFDDRTGMSLYERTPEGAGMWLKPSAGSDHDATTPTDELEAIVAELVNTDGVPAKRVDDLPSHERFFVGVIHGTIEQKPDGVPDPVYTWMNECAERVDS